MFTINQDKEITYTTEPEAGAPCFNSAEQLSQLADAHNWSREYLEAIWNGFAGWAPFYELKPVKKFRNRPYGIAQIWKAIQRLASAAPVEVKPVPKPAEKLKAAKTDRAASSDTKRAEVLRMLQRKTGASLEELMDKFGWQRHTVRGFISTLGSKHGVTIASEKHETKGRIYRTA